MAYTGKFTDRSPLLKPAGLLSFKKDENVANCLVHDVTEDEARSFACLTGPMDYRLPPPKTNNYKGFYSDVQACVQPEVGHGFYEELTKEFKDTVYDSYWKKPLGKVADPTPNLPAGMNPAEVCFGKATPIVDTAGELINPPKSFPKVVEESEVGHEMYKRTHNDYNPGEQTKRNYVRPFKEDLVWGKSTPCDPQGGCIKKVITTDPEEKILVSKILADYRKRNKCLVGKVFAPNENIKCVSDNHAFGKPHKRELYGVGELMKDCPPSLEKLDLYDELSHINTLRNNITKKGLPFPHRDLVEAFHQLDPNNSGCIPLGDAYKILAGFQICPEKQLFEDLLKRMNFQSKDGVVAYEKMADLLNINVMFPEITKLTDVPSELLNFETTNQLAHKYHSSGEFKRENLLTAGIPPKPHVSVEASVSPSIFTSYGLQPKDFFVSRSPEYLRDLLVKMGCEMEENVFKNIWDTAKDRNGCVSVNSFFDALKSFN